MNKQEKSLQSLSVQAIQRLPYYLQRLKDLERQGVETISAPAMAGYLGLHEIQVRKDLAAISSTSGKPRAGFPVKKLIHDMEQFLGYHNVNEAVLVGVGQLGRALLFYDGFKAYGLNIVTAFDNNPSLIGSTINEKKILSTDTISDLCQRMNIHIGIITVPAECAQEVCNQLVDGGVCGIWNFAPTHLSVPKHVLVQNENMAASLALLSKHLGQLLETE